MSDPDEEIFRDRMGELIFEAFALPFLVAEFPPIPAQLHKAMRSFLSCTKDAVSSRNPDRESVIDDFLLLHTTMLSTHDSTKEFVNTSSVQ
ncbi:hypothetical protein EAI_04924 [Harpegnathos saltator]|uniref:Uncharacterized protein n=1 Tax=Harpegnathos saltator TaxID=610380 RepID=E2BS99_HARSA|nr:hypothetical protein EAI_04924 [Harpegnathos saltator]